MNPNAPIFWTLCLILGYLPHETSRGAVIGLAIGLSISLTSSFFREYYKVTRE